MKTARAALVSLLLASATVFGATGKGSAASLSCGTDPLRLRLPDQPSDLHVVCEKSPGGGPVSLHVVYAGTRYRFQSLTVPDDVWDMPDSIGSSDLSLEDFDLDGYPDIALAYASGRFASSTMVWVYVPEACRFEFSPELLDALKDVGGFEVNRKTREIETSTRTQDDFYSSHYAAARGFRLLAWSASYVDRARGVRIESSGDFRGPEPVERVTEKPLGPEIDE